MKVRGEINFGSDRSSWNAYLGLSVQSHPAVGAYRYSVLLKNIHPWPRFGGKDVDGHKSWLAFRVSRGQSLRGNRNVTLGLSASMGRSDETKQNQYTTLEKRHMPEQLMSGFFLKEALLHVETTLEHSFSKMHWIHSSLMPWRINCPVANTFKFSNLESWGSIRCIAVVSDQSNIWHFDSVPWCRNSAFLFIYFPGQWTKLCLQQDITASIASVRFIDQIDTREKIQTWWAIVRVENVFFSMKTKFVNFPDLLLITLGRIYALSGILKVSGIVKPKS